MVAALEAAIAHQRAMHFQHGLTRPHMIEVEWLVPLGELIMNIDV